MFFEIFKCQILFVKCLNYLQMVCMFIVQHLVEGEGAGGGAGGGVGAGVARVADVGGVGGDGGAAGGGGDEACTQQQSPDVPRAMYECANSQHTPKPTAQLPSPDPPRVEHSELVVVDVIY